VSATWKPLLTPRNFIPFSSSDRLKGQLAGVSDFHMNGLKLKVSGLTKDGCDIAVKPLIINAIITKYLNCVFITKYFLN
jgi:hypothetical protein